MKLGYRYLIAAFACLGLLLLSLTVGLHHIIPFQSVAAEIAFASLLFAATVIFMFGGIREIINEYMEV